MAVVLKFRYGSTEVLLTAAKGGGLRHIDWDPQVATPMEGVDPGPVTETMDISAERNTDDNLAATIQALDKMRLQADRFRTDPTVGEPVWLHAKMSGETGERRAAVRSIKYTWLSSPVEVTGMAAAHQARLRLTVEREPWWERITPRALPAHNNGNEASGAAILYDYTATYDIAGDVAARVEYFVVQVAAGDAELGRLWIGLRSAKHGTPGNFDPIRECENGTAGTDTSFVTDATASAGYRATIYPGTEPWAKRLTLTLLQDPAVNYADNLGDFLWLLRAQVSEAGTWEAQLRWGYGSMADDDFRRGPVVELEGTSWDYYEMGRMAVPLRDLHAIPLSLFGATYETKYMVQLWARRTSGASSLNADCFVLLPIDEGWLKSWSYDVSSGYHVFFEGADGHTQCVVWSGGTWDFTAASAWWNFRLPVGDGRMVIAYAGPSSSDILNGIRIPEDPGFYRERWASLRGVESG